VPVDIFHYDPAVWGPDTGELNPNRWLEDGPDGPGLGDVTSPDAMMTFGAGPWRCIGQHYARAILVSLLAAVVRRFDVDVVVPVAETENNRFFTSPTLPAIDLLFELQGDKACCQWGIGGAFN